MIAYYGYFTHYVVCGKLNHSHQKHQQISISFQLLLRGRRSIHVFSLLFPSCFCEDDRVFTFGPCLFTDEPQKVSEQLRITNPRGIPCEVNFALKPRNGADGGELAFEVQPTQLMIPAHEHRYVTVSFTPPQLQTYHCIFEATVTDGTDPRTNYLTFEIRGDGTVG
jgi:hypothetical protein